jgi:hypothetical protein
MSSLTRRKKTEHFKSYCHTQDQIVSWNLGRHCQPTGLTAGMLRGCAAAVPRLSQIPLLVVSIGSMTSICRDFIRATQCKSEACVCRQQVSNAECRFSWSIYR